MCHSLQNQILCGTQLNKTKTNVQALAFSYCKWAVGALPLTKTPDMEDSNSRNCVQRCWAASGISTTFYLKQHLWEFLLPGCLSWTPPLKQEWHLERSRPVSSPPHFLNHGSEILPRGIAWSWEKRSPKLFSKEIQASNKLEKCRLGGKRLRGGPQLQENGKLNHRSTSLPERTRETGSWNKPLRGQSKPQTVASKQPFQKSPNLIESDYAEIYDPENCQKQLRISWQLEPNSCLWSGKMVVKDSSKKTHARLYPHRNKGGLA